MPFIYSYNFVTIRIELVYLHDYVIRKKVILLYLVESLNGRAMSSRSLRSNFTNRADLRNTRRHSFIFQASIQQPVHGGQWPLIWRRRTTSRGYKERQDSQDFRPVPRASCRPIPPLYLIPRPSRPTSPVSVSNSDRQHCIIRCSRNCPPPYA